MRRLSVAIAVALVAASCGAGELSLTEYAEETSALIYRVDARIDVVAAQLFGDAQTVEGVQGYLEMRVDGFQELLEGFEALSPPDRAAELHEWVVRLLTDQLAAEKSRYEVANAVRSVEDLDLVWGGPESAAVQLLEQESIDLCHAAQQTMDDTQIGEGFEDMPWMPRDVAEVVSISFGCPPA